MNLSAPFIHKPIMTTLVMLTILMVGVWSYMQLPVSNMPDVEYPNINVTVGYPGANPETMANNVATPLEKEFLTIDGLVSATSSNTLGNTSIILQFDLNKNIDVAALDVQSAISRAIPNLPTDLPSAPVYKKVNPSLVPIIILALTSKEIPVYKLYDYASTFIGQQLALINGVAEVVTYGSPYAVRVQVDPNKLASTGITLLDIAAALKTGNPYQPTGFLDGPLKAPNILVDGQLTRAAAYDPLIVKYVDNAPVRIRDLGKAVDSLQNYRFGLVYMDKDIVEPGVVLAILPRPGSNAVNISRDMHRLLPAIYAQLPPGATLRIVNDKTDAVKESILDVQFTLVISFILVVLVIYLYLGKARDTLIPAMVLPMSVVGTFALMHMYNYSLDNLSLLALILAIGFIIDDAIVVIENIVRRVEMGEKPWKAALEGSKQISFTILSMTLSLIAVFIPLLFMGGLLGKILSEFAITLTMITLLSGLISLSLTPMLCSLFIPERVGEEKETIGHRFNEKLVSYYKPGLEWILRNRLVALAVLAISMLLSMWLFVVIPKDFIPNDDIGFFMAYTQSAEGTSSKRMNELQNQIADVVRADPNVDRFVSISANQQFRSGILYIHLKPRSERKPILEVISGLQKQTAQFIGINAYYKNIPMIDLSVGFQVKGAYQYALKSLDSKKLYPVAADFIQQMRLIKGIQGLNTDFEISAPQINVDIPRDKASSLGVTAADVETAFQLAYAGGRVTRIQTPINQYDVILELQPKFQQYIEAFDKIYIRSNNNQGLIPLKSVANWSEGVGPTSINHINQFPGVTISYNLTGELALGDVTKEIDKIAGELLPADVTGTAIGAAQTFQESIVSSAFLLLMTVVAIYIVLGILYESYIHPITILTTLPPAVLGGLLVLYIFNLPLSLYSFLGIILLIGIVKKNGIMMVDFALENIREKGETPEKSIYDACLVRFRPIMMTTLTAIVGALPIALGFGAGAEARRPLGLVIIGGLFLSQFITLYITPVIYLYMEKLNEIVTIKAADDGNDK